MTGALLLVVASSFSCSPRTLTSRTPEEQQRHIVPPESWLLRSSAASFDFSAPSEWETFYKERCEVVEWHSSVPLERIASYVPIGSDHSPPFVILMVGCGNSRLPATLLANRSNLKVVLLDTSQTCLDQLQGIYGTSVEYVCGNAVQLDRLFGSSNMSTAAPSKFDMIIDKGLSDALFCSEGWNGPIEELYRNAANVLKPNGKYLLISYRLPSSTKEFLSEVGQQVNLQWEFDIPKDSNERVGVSLAMKLEDD